MKKVGIVSIYKTGNYGGTLQAYALQKVINDAGLARAQIIPYCCDAINGKLDLAYFKTAGAVKTAAAVVDKLCYLPRMKKVDRFIHSFAGEREMTRRELAELNEQYDIFLSGSDQLWNPEIQQGDCFYLQDFVTDPVKKRSYASSFGRNSLPEDCIPAYRELLGQFHTITVREKTGADIVEQLTGRRPEVVLDPTLLLTAEQWEQILPPLVMEGDYLFTYRMTYTSTLTQAAVRGRKELDCRVLAVPFLLGHCPKTCVRPDLSSLEWIRGIYDSRYVVTDSFHGVVFSILFSKPFYYVVTSPTAKARLSRLETLLEQLGISDRLVEDPEQCDFTKSIDYPAVQERLSRLREHSMACLRKMLE